MDLCQFSQRYKNKAEAFKLVVQACQNILKHNPIAAEARDYLNSRMSQECQNTFNLGYFPTDEQLPILYESVSPDLIKALGLVYPYHVQNGDHRVFIDKGTLDQHNLIMPYRDLFGNIVALVGRTILSESGRKQLNLQKYKYTQFPKSLQLFGLYQAKHAILKQKSVILVEGQIDCISCHERGIKNVIALGGSSLSKYQFNLIRTLTSNVLLLLDNDQEGKRAEAKIIKRYSNDAIIKKLNLPDNFAGKDVDQFLRSSISIDSFISDLNRRLDA